MTKIAFLFPGQGAQYVGMGRALAAQYPEAARHFAEANEVLGFDLSKLIFEGPDYELKKTANQQPAILTVSAAVLSLLTKAGIRPDVVAGLALGEYTALVAAGSLSFDEAVSLVRRRGEYMEEAVPPGAGGMAAILGLDAKAVDRICTQACMQTSRYVAGAIYNCPGQIVISGHAQAIDVAMGLAAEAGGKAVKLSVTAPFHSALLAPAGVRLTAALEAVALRTAGVPVVSNVTADYVQAAASIKGLLVQQVFSPVRWEESVRRMLADGVDLFVELGPGRSLSGFLKRIDQKAHVLNVANATSLARLLDQGLPISG